MTRARRSLLSLTLFAVAAAPLSGARATPSYEGFSGYSAGSPIASPSPGGGYGWKGAWGGGGLSLTATGPGLAYSGLATSPGAATSGPPSTNTVAWYYRDLDTPIGEGSTLYVGFLLRPETGISDYGGLGLMGPADGIFAGKSGSASGGSNYYGLEGSLPDGSDADTKPDPLVAPTGIMACPGQTAFLVIKATMLAGADRFDLFVDPIPGAAEPTPSATIGTEYGIDLGSAIYLAINNAGNWTTDEIRVGSTFASVTPAPLPATLALLLAGLAPLRARAARRPR